MNFFIASMTFLNKSFTIRKHDTERGGDTEKVLLPAGSLPNAYKSQNCVKLILGAQNAIQVSHEGDRTQILRLSSAAF